MKTSGEAGYGCSADVFAHTVGDDGGLLQSGKGGQSHLRERDWPGCGRWGVFAPGDGYTQAQRCFEIIRLALRDLGADLASVVRTRMFVTDISRWQEFGRVHAEAFSGHPPATAMVEVSRLIDQAMLIEVEADAVVDD